MSENRFYTVLSQNSTCNCTVYVINILGLNQAFLCRVTNSHPIMMKFIPKILSRSAHDKNHNKSTIVKGYVDLYANIHVLSKNDSGYLKKYINIYISFISSHQHTFLNMSKNNSGYLKKMKFKFFVICTPLICVQMIYKRCMTVGCVRTIYLLKSSQLGTCSWFPT